MKIKHLLGGLFLFSFLHIQAQTLENENKSLSYDDCISSYEYLASNFETAALYEMGTTDVGAPLHLFVINSSGKTYPSNFEEDKLVLLINNGIHPGEPCGIDASVRFAYDLLQQKEHASLLDSTIVCIIPVYNVGGAMNRGCCSRANQNGPEEYGFRGNARNLDLNRDFVKRDSENARSFSKIMHAVDPHYFIDTHTSNGADYQYTMTMITTQTNKLSKPLVNYTQDVANTWIYKDMAERGWEMVPYVYMMGRIPDDGIKDYLESPRYSTGYAALFNTVGFTSETHMFKPFKDRVESTYQFEFSLLNFMHEHSTKIKELKNKADQHVSDQKEFPLVWELDTNHYDVIPFKGYKAEFIESRLTGKERLKYNREKPVDMEIRYYNVFKPTVKVMAPKYYIIPQGWTEVIERLRENGVEMRRFDEDTSLRVKTYFITDYDTPNQPYEGHYLHSNVKTESTWEDIQFYAGDYIIEVNQKANRYIVEMLEPRAPDSFFAWNFFDSMLQQKEWFSDYIFEEHALDMLEDDAALKAEFENLKAEDADFASNHWGQLYWIYKRSGFYENSFNRYPVFRYDENLRLSRD